MKQAIAAAVTPFTHDNKIDLESAARLYKFGLERGIDGFFLFGSMGEWPLLTDDDKLALAEVACDVIVGKGKLLLGVADTGLPSILGNMERLARFNHTHWTVILPVGIGAPADPVKYLHRIADAADRPLYYYHIAADITPAQFGEIMSHPKIVGVKNSSGGLRLRKELVLLKKTVDFEIFEGEEWVIDEACWMGCDGAVAGFGATGVKLIKGITKAVDAGDWPKASDLQAKLVDIFHRVYGLGVPYWCIGQKYALVQMGLLSSAKSRVDSQQSLPEEAKTRIEKCVAEYRDYLI